MTEVDLSMDDAIASSRMDSPATAEHKTESSAEPEPNGGSPSTASALNLIKKKYLHGFEIILICSRNNIILFRRSNPSTNSEHHVLQPRLVDDGNASWCDACHRGLENGKCPYIYCHRYGK